MERVAQCHCGSLRAIAQGEPDWSYLCHCKACQRRTGTVVHFGAYFQKDRVRLEGPSKVYSRRADSGFAIDFHFCPGCGSSVYWMTGKRPDQLGIAAGCFADPAFSVPTHSVWEYGKHPWLRLPDGVIHRQGGTNADGSAMAR